MKKKKHFLSMILGLALSLTILFPSFAQASGFPLSSIEKFWVDCRISLPVSFRQYIILVTFLKSSLEVSIALYFLLFSSYV